MTVQACTAIMIPPAPRRMVSTRNRSIALLLQHAMRPNVGFGVQPYQNPTTLSGGMGQRCLVPPSGLLVVRFVSEMSQGIQACSGRFVSEMSQGIQAYLFSETHFERCLKAVRQSGLLVVRDSFQRCLKAFRLTCSERPV